ncbi:N-acetylmuramoyl-L-alanine amidase, partial [Candidatus Sumerlaeota bacterium]|nr:N-acetylmuramoyl-L-alanine amidase [Candidatus Sumerlaeota bacterium]
MAALGLAGLVAPSVWADDLEDIRQMPPPARVAPEEFQAPGHFQPSEHLGIVPIPIPHFNPVGPERDIDTVIIHYTSGINVDPENPHSIDINWNIFDYYNVSSHYVIGRDGIIYQLVRESDRAWHAGGSIMPAPDNREGVNDFSIGIEIVNIHGDPFSEEQYEAAIALVRDIRQRHPIPLENITGHEHIGGERAIHLGMRRSPKIDPGPSFDWERFMEGVAAPEEPPEPVFADGPISGTVFRDENANGLRDAGEAGWPGVGVSNGVSIALTDEEGHYTLEPAEEAMELVFVIQPADCRLMQTFHRPICEIEDLAEVDFGLIPEEVGEGPLTFAQVTDIHINQREDFPRFLDALEEVDSHPAPIDFIMATGDLVNVGGRPWQLETYRAVAERAERPWMACFGNHDSDTRSYEGAVHYRHFVGPDYHSFDRGDCHFVVRNSIIVTDAMEAWIDEDVRIFGEGKTVVVFQHYPPTTIERYERLVDLGARAVVTGHWHSNRLVDFEGLLSINSPTFMMGGIDLSPSGFRLITIDDDHVTSRFMFGRTGRILTVHSPSEDLVVEAPLTAIHAAVYDSESDVVEARFEISGGGGVAPESREGELHAHSPLGWSAEITPELITPGPYSVTLTAVDGRGESWSTDQEFELLPETIGSEHGDLTPWPMHMGDAMHLGQTDLEITPPLAVNWIATHPVTFEFGSPVTDGERVHIGLRDRDNLEHSGVVTHDADTGELLWFAPTQTAVCHTVATDGERVYASDHGGRVYAFDAETGGEIWTHDLHGDARFRWIYSAPAIVEGRLVCGSSGGLASLDCETGEPLWEIRPGGDWISSWCSPAVADGVVVMGGIWQSFGDNRMNSLAAFDLETEDLLWTQSTSGLHGSPTISDGRVHTVDTQSQLRVNDLHTGE